MSFASVSGFTKNILLENFGTFLYDKCHTIGTKREDIYKNSYYLSWTKNSIFFMCKNG